MPRRATSVLIGSSARATPEAGIIARAKVDGSTKGNLAGTIKDVGDVHAFFVGKRGIHVTKVFADVDPAIVNKGAVMRALADAFGSGRDDVVVYYSGHGRGVTGAWCVEEPCAPGAKPLHSFITPEEVWELWRARENRRPDQQLIVVSDSCHAGYWVDAAERLGFKALAACQRDEVTMDGADGGLFTQHWVRSPSHDRISRWNFLSPLYYVTTLLGVPLACARAAAMRSAPCSSLGGGGFTHIRVGEGCLFFPARWSDLLDPLTWMDIHTKW